MTQEALGERASLSHKFIGEVERGVSNPSIESVAAIAKALDADIADLFGGAARPAGAYDASRKHLAVVRDAQERLTNALKEWQNATLGRVAPARRRRKPSKKSRSV
jgi:transcriptional regulator with XRE-family HTH domain